MKIEKEFDIAHKELDYFSHRYDYVIIDIDLEIDNPGNSTKNYSKLYKKDLNEFQKEAGFYLFLLLLTKGFPVERMVFLTGNTLGSRRDKLANQALKTILKLHILISN